MRADDMDNIESLRETNDRLSSAIEDAVSKLDTYSSICGDMIVWDDVAGKYLPLELLLSNLCGELHRIVRKDDKWCS